MTKEKLQDMGKIGSTVLVWASAMTFTFTLNGELFGHLASHPESLVIIGALDFVAYKSSKYLYSILSTPRRDTI